MKLIPVMLPAGLLAAAAALADPAPQPLPAAAVALIDQVHAAALARDFDALEAAMTTEFKWSFGGDADAAQALAEWRRDPEYLRELGRVTALPCGIETADTVQCPSAGGTDYRAGFQETAEGWRMVYFLAGD